LHMAQLMPLPLTVSCFSKIQIGFTFLVSAHSGSPRKRAIKWVCVCVCLAMYDCSPLQPSPYIKFTNSTDCGQMYGHTETDPAEAECTVDRARAEEHWSYAGNDDDRVKQIHQRSLGRVHTWQPHRLHYSTHWTTPPHICSTAIIQVNLH